jgi:hypothetical protein
MKYSFFDLLKHNSKNNDKPDITLTRSGATYEEQPLVEELVERLTSEITPQVAQDQSKNFFVSALCLGVPFSELEKLADAIKNDTKQFLG